MKIQILNNNELEKVTAGEKPFNNFKDGFTALSCALMGEYPGNSNQSRSYGYMLLRDENNNPIYDYSDKIVGYSNTIKANYNNFESKTTRAKVIAAEAAVVGFVGIPPVALAAGCAMCAVAGVRAAKKYLTNK